MCMPRLVYLVAIVPISLLLTISFFVLFALRKVEEKGLKAFGYVVVSFLWLAALIVFSGAVYKTAKGSTMNCMYRQKMMGMSMQQAEQKGNMPAMNMSSMAMPEKKMSKCGGNKGNIFKGE